MLDDIYKIGLMASKEKSILDESIMIDKETELTIVYCIEFNKNLEYIKVMPKEFNELEQHIYLLRKNSSAGINFAPTAKITEFEKTLDNKIIGWFKNIVNNNKKIYGNGERTEKILNIAKKICEELERNKSKIIEEISHSFSKKEKYLLTVTIDGAFPYEIDWILEGYEKLVKLKVFGKELNFGTCYVCRKSNVPIVPEYGVYKFYTKDKPGFISGGFKQKDFWRNCPVCTSCQPVLNKAKQYIEKTLKYYYYGLTYYIIPSTIGKMEEIQNTVQVLQENNRKRQTLEKEAKTAFETYNELILYLLKDIGNINSFRLIFIKKEKSAERILLDIKDVYPIRFQEMYEAKDEIDKNYQEVLKYKDKDKNIKTLKFNFSFFREFLSKSDDKNKDNDLNKIFLGLTEDMLNKNQIELKTLLPHYMRTIRRLIETEDSGSLKFATLKSMSGIQYLIIINCIKLRKGESMESKYDEFFEKYNCGLDTNVKKALVLVGAIVQKVMNIQYREIKSTPFNKNLKSLRLREEEVKGVVAQVVNKMQEYDCYSLKSKEIVEEISRLIFSSSSDWKLSVDEINFYIVAGMALQKEIYGEKKEEENINE